MDYSSVNQTLTSDQLDKFNIKQAKELALRLQDVGAKLPSLVRKSFD